MATIVTVLRKADGTAAGGQKVLFRRVTFPAAGTGATVTAGDIIATADAGGAIEQDLVAGDYEIWVGSSRRRGITVPDDSASHLLENLLLTGQSGGVIDPAPTSSKELFDDAAELADVKISPLVKFVMLMADSQQPTPSTKVLFVREATAATADGVNVIADKAGTTFTRVQ